MRKTARLRRPLLLEHSTHGHVAAVSVCTETRICHNSAVLAGSSDLQPVTHSIYVVYILLFIICQMLMPTGGEKKEKKTHAGFKVSKNTVCSQVNI